MEPTQEEVVVEQPKVEQPKVEQPKVEQPKVERPKPALRPSVFSLQGALQGGIKGESREQEGEQGEQGSGARRIDQAAVEKITAAKGEIITFLSSSRPRFVPLFEAMELTAEAIKIEVPTPELREELLRSEIEVMSRVVEIAKIDGYMELRVEVNEELQIVRRPIKIEDRIAHFTALNPTIVELTERLDLQVE